MQSTRKDLEQVDNDRLCYNNNAINKASGVFNIISDFAILILPMLPIWRLQMSRRNKILMSGVFATGLL